MKLKSVRFNNSVRIPGGNEAESAQAGARLRLDYGQGLVTVIAMANDEPAGKLLVPMSNVRSMEPDEETDAKAK